jgi:hypothetical protein
VTRNRPIPSFGNADLIFDDNRANRHLTHGFGTLRQSKGMPHPRFVVMIIGYSHSIVAGGLPEIS